MKQFFKRSLIWAVVLSVLLGAVPAVFAQTEETGGVLDASDVSVQGTTDFGQLLTEGLQAGQEGQTASEYEAGYSVTALEIIDGVATVTYDTLEPANLVVAIYTEDGMQLLTSEKVEVTKDDTIAIVEFGEALPTYFRAEAFLLDTYDYSPLCASYDTPLYTQEMQELLASTVDDYADELVLNLDESNDTNFAVYKESVKQIPRVDGVNTVVSSDDEAMLYVIENIDEQITSLQAGDIVAYEYIEEDVMIVKVASVTLDGTTATIVGDDLDMQDVFSHVKVEGFCNTEDVAVDTTNMADGVSYGGLVKDEVQTYSFENSETATYAHEFPLEFKKEKKSDHLDAKVDIKGSVKISAPINLKYYVSSETAYTEFTVKPTVTASLSVSGEVTGQIPLGDLWKVSPCPGVYVGLEPKFVVGFEGKVEAKVVSTFTIGFKFEVGEDMQNLSTTPNVIPDPSLDIEANIKIGLDLAPYVKIISKRVLKVDAEFTAMIVLNVKADGDSLGTQKKNAEVVHGCKNCLAMDLSFQIQIGGEIKFAGWDKWTYTIDLADLNFEIGKMHISFDHGGFGWGQCAYKEYRVTMLTKKATGAYIEGATVFVSGDKGESHTTGKNGTTYTYLPAGEYIFSATLDGVECEQAIELTEPEKVILAPKTETNTGSDVLDKVQKEDVVDKDDSTKPDNIVRLLNDKFEVGPGINAMFNEDDYFVIGKFENNDSEVGINLGSGISVVDYPIMYLSIESSVPYDIVWYDANNNKWIHAAGDYYWAFIEGGDTSEIYAGTNGYVRLDMREAYTWNGTLPSNAALNSMYIVPKGEGVMTIRDICMATENAGKCGNKVSWELKDDGELHLYGSGSTYNFAENPQAPWDSMQDSIRSIVVDEGITGFGSCAFEFCRNAMSVRLPNSLKEIGIYAFRGCYELTYVVIPDGVETITKWAFSSCDNLEKVVIGESVKTIAYHTFSFCEKLETILIPAGVKTIEDSAFYDSYNLKDVYYKGTEADWNAISINTSGNASLSSATKHYGYTGNMLPLSIGTVENNTEYQAVVGGSYETVVPSEGEAYKIATFEGLVAGKQYTMLALADTEATDKLDRNNLLYIKQAVATEDGTLQFTYMPRENTAVSYVMVCGSSDKDLNDAVITFNTMVSGSEITAIEPIVVYNGQTLTEGEDYVVVGKTDYTDAGEFTCTVRGIYDYTGTVQCTYNVKLLGDLVKDDIVNTKDVREILKYNLGSVEFDEEQLLVSDANGDGKTDTIDTRIFLKLVLGVE